MERTSIRLSYSNIEEVSNLQLKLPNVIQFHLRQLTKFHKEYLKCLGQTFNEVLDRTRSKQLELDKLLSDIVRTKSVDLSDFKSRFPTYEGSCVPYFLTEYAQAMLIDYDYISSEAFSQAKNILTNRPAKPKAENFTVSSKRYPVLKSSPEEITKLDIYKSELIECQAELARDLINEDIFNQLIAQFNVNKVVFNKNGFIIEGMHPMGVDSAKSMLGQVINNYLVDRIKWVYFTEEGDVEDFKSVTTQIIENAYQSDKYMINLSNANSKLRLIFGHPHHLISEDNKFYLTARRCVDNRYDKELFSIKESEWFWKEDNGTFQPFTVEASSLIQIASEAGCRGVVVQGINGKIYNIDLGKEKQYSRVHKRERVVKRFTKSKMT